jgi:hypothetical protein
MGKLRKLTWYLILPNLKFGTIRNLVEPQLPDVGWILLFGDYIATYPTRAAVDRVPRVDVGFTRRLVAYFGKV